MRFTRWQLLLDSNKCSLQLVKNDDPYVIETRVPNLFIKFVVFGDTEITCHKQAHSPCNHIRFKPLFNKVFSQLHKRFVIKSYFSNEKLENG